MRNLLRIVPVVLALGAQLARAHDFWLQPTPYRLVAGATVPLTLQVGHGPYRQRSPIAARRIVRFQAIAPDGAVRDLRDRLRLGEPAEDADVRLSAPGTHVLLLETDDRAQSFLPALRFNDYLQAEGLTPALAERQRTHRMDADGAERYSRHAKALVQVGATGAGDAVTRPLGLALEIVPERNPYATPKAATLPVRVFYQGRPLAGALVKLTCLEHDERPLEVHRTDAAGRARFAMPGAGSWLLNVIWTRPSQPSSETDFDTAFSSLSFGFAPR